MAAGRHWCCFALPTPQLIPRLFFPLTASSEESKVIEAGI